MTRNRPRDDLEANAITENEPAGRNEAPQDKTPVHTETVQHGQTDSEQDALKDADHKTPPRTTTITFEHNLPNPGSNNADNTVLRVPGPRDRDDGL